MASLHKQENTLSPEGGEGRGEGRWACLAVALVLSGCGANPSAAECPPESYLNYRNFGAPFLRSWCTGCHSEGLTGEARAGAPVGVNFDTYASTLARLDGIKQRAAIDMPTMPPRGAPGKEERALLSEWLSCGAP